MKLGNLLKLVLRLEVCLLQAKGNKSEARPSVAVDYAQISVLTNGRADGQFRANSGPI